MATLMSLSTQSLPFNFSPELISAKLTIISNIPPFFPKKILGRLASGPLFVREEENPPMNHLSLTNPRPTQLALSLDLEEIKITMKALRQNNREMEKILATLKVPKAEVLTLDRTFTHSFEDLINVMLMVFIPLDLNKIDLQILIPYTNIFHTAKIKPLSKKRKKMMDTLLTPTLSRGKRY